MSSKIKSVLKTIESKQKTESIIESRHTPPELEDRLRLGLRMVRAKMRGLGEGMVGKAMEEEVLEEEAMVQLRVCWSSIMTVREV